MKKYLFLLLSLILISCSKDNANISKKQHDENIPKEQDIIIDKLNYLNYTLEKQTKIEHGFTNYIMVLKSNTGEIIKRFEKAGSEEHWNKWKLVDLIKGGNKELVITQYSGGAHCCEYNWIYEFNPQLIEIFNSCDYESLGFMSDPLDINNDGNYELLFQNLTFDYFYRCCHAASPMNYIIFEYNPRLKKYIVQNIKFKNYILSDIPDTIEIDSEFKDIKPTDNPEEVDPGGYYLGPILKVVIKYLYAGENQKAWEILDKYYILSDKEKVKDAILKKLKEDKCYQKM